MALWPWTLSELNDIVNPLALPPGCKALGAGSSSEGLKSWLNHWRYVGDKLDLLLVLAGSSTAEVEGISAAGATASSRRYTALADAELLINGPKSGRSFPLPPLEAGISPALISYVASHSMGLSPWVVAVGLSHQPTFPHLRLEVPSMGPSDCVSSGKAMDLTRVQALWGKGLFMGRRLKRSLVLAECVPGGTTTAHAVLTGFGLPVSDFISGSVHKPPISLKKSIVEKGLKASGLRPDPLPQKLLAAIGDPFQPVAAGVLMGAREAGQQVLLAGGSQMVAVLALTLAALKPHLRNDFMKGVAIGTTYWLAAEPSLSFGRRSAFGCLLKCVEDHFGVKILGLASGLRFHSSSQQSLRDYELGYIKEGVGAGALTLLAQLHGASIQELVRDCDQAVTDLNAHFCTESTKTE